MALDIYMVITDDRSVVLAGESPSPVYDPYTRTTVAKPVEVFSVTGETENTFAFSGGGGTGAGKIVFDAFTLEKRVDSVSQTTFLAQATGVLWRYVDLLFVESAGEPTNPPRPYLSYRLGSVGVSDIRTISADDEVHEQVSLVFATLQIGYQATKPDGTPAAFVPVGWDRVRNIKI